MRFERRRGQRVGERGERGEGARRDPGAAALGYGRGGAVEIFGGEQVVHGLLPLPAPEEEVGEARVLGGHRRAPPLDAEAPPQEVAEERVEAVLFAARVRGERDEDVSARERLKHHGRFRVEARARLRLGAL